jgi:hypothetical protein
MPGSSLVARQRNSRGERRASAARRPRNQLPNAGACLATPKDSRSPGAIPRAGHPGGPSGQMSVRLRTRPGIRAAHAAANGPPAEMPSSAADSARTPSSTSAASSAQSASRRSRRGSVPPTPGRSGATMRNPSSRAAWVNRRADSRESASPWHNRTGAAPCSPVTSTAITLPSPRLTSIAPWSRVPAGRHQPAGPGSALVCGSAAAPANPGSSQQNQVRTVSGSHHRARRAERAAPDAPARRNADSARVAIALDTGCTASRTPSSGSWSGRRRWSIPAVSAGGSGRGASCELGGGSDRWYSPGLAPAAPPYG